MPDDLLSLGDHRPKVATLHVELQRGDTTVRLVRIEVPPLRGRREDIVDLVQLFLARASQRGRQPSGITDEAMRWLCAHDWPGNVRELANFVERAVALAEHDTIVLSDVRDHASQAVTGDELNLADAAQRPSRSRMSR